MKPCCLSLRHYSVADKGHLTTELPVMHVVERYDFLSSSREEFFMDHTTPKMYADADTEVRRVMERANVEAHDFVIRQRALIDAIADALMKARRGGGGVAAFKKTIELKKNTEPYERVSSVHPIPTSFIQFKLNER